MLSNPQGNSEPEVLLFPKWRKKTRDGEACVFSPSGASGVLVLQLCFPFCMCFEDEDDEKEKKTQHGHHNFL